MSISILALCTLSLPVQAMAQAGDSSSFYPLAVGNYWQYDSYAWGSIGVWDTLIVEISRDSSFDGNTYQMVAGRSLRYKNTWQNFERVDSSGDIIRGDPASHQESLVYRLSDTSGSWWADGSYYLHRFDSCGVFSLFGSPSSVLYVGEYDPIDTTLRNQRLLIEGVGYYTTRYFGLVDYGGDFLHGARIDGLKVGSIDAVQGLSKESSPRDFQLGPPYPNPFNPSTRFTYYLPVRARVQLLVFDLLGRVVERLVDEVQQPGSYSVQWHGNNAASGVYICQMLAQGRARTQKALLLR